MVRAKNASGFETRDWVRKGFSKLSSTLVARAKGLRRMQEELHDAVDPGSTPGCAQPAQ
jgi:hypothetical protein